MFLYSSRLAFCGLPRRLARTGGPLAGLLTAMLALPAGPALATVPAQPAPAPASTSPSAACPGQTLTQPFAAWNDLNYYTLVPGGNLVNPLAAGWRFGGGAQLVNAAQPNGTVGPVLDLPSHA